MLYEMLVGRPPFKGATALDTLDQVRAQEPVPVRRLQPTVTRDLETICLKCLAKEPVRRYASAAALAEDLRRFLADEPIMARPTGAWERAVKWARRQPAVAGLTAAVVVTALLGAEVAGWQWKRAVDERATALRLADDLGIQRDAAEWQTYRAKVAAAASALQLHNVAAARRHLEAAPARYRNWEWRHFTAQLDAAQAALPGHRGFVRALVFSPDGRRLVSASDDRTARLWDVGTRAPSAVWAYDGAVQYLALRPDGTRLACTTAAGTLWIHDLTARPEAGLRRGLGKQAYSLAFSPDGSLLGVGTSDGTVALIDAATGEDRFVLKDPSLPRRALAFSPDGRWFAVGNPDGPVHLWGTADGRLSEPMRNHPALPLEAAFSPDGRFLVTTGVHPDDDLRLWRVGDHQPVSLLPGHTGQVLRPTFSPDGSRIASVSDDKTARLWDGVTGRPVASLEGHASGLTRVVFSPDSRRLVTASWDQTIKVWEAATRQCLATLRGHAAASNAVAWSPDGTSLAAAAAEGTVRLYDPNAVWRTEVLRGHADDVTDVAFSPDGTHAVSASSDGTLRYWDTRTGQGAAMHQGRASYLSVAFNPNGTQVVSVVQLVATVYLWDLPPGKPVRRLSLPPGSLMSRGCAFHPGGTLVAGGCRTALSTSGTCRPAGM
jgi:WD40 repeat protein